MTEPVPTPPIRPNVPHGAVAGAAVVDGMPWPEALDAAIAQVVAVRHDQAPDLLVLFASAAYADDFPRLVASARARTGAATLVGCSGSGVVGPGHEIESRPGIALLACWCPGARFQPVRLHQEFLPVLQDPTLWESWAEMSGVPDAQVRGWLLLLDPFRMDGRAALAALAARSPGRPIVGGMASADPHQRRAWVFFDDQVYDEGGVALAIGGPYRLHPLVAQGAEPIGESWTITEVDRNTVLAISNRPATAVMQATLDGLPAASRQRVGRNLLVGFAADEYQDEFHRGDFLVRGVLGVDHERGGIVVGGLPRVGQTIHFHLRDASTADVDLHQGLAETKATLGGCQPVAGVLCTCNGRGQALFGVRHHDAAAIQAAFGSLPLAGVFSNGEIGPVGGHPYLHGFTATLALLVHEPDDGAGTSDPIDVNGEETRDTP